MAARVCLVHYHEVGLKGKNRAHFEHILMDNIKAALAAFSVNAVSRISGYILVTFNEHQADEAARVIRTVPGVARVSLAYHTNRDPQEYCAAAVKALREFGSFDSFKVHAKRSNTDYELTSIDINRQVGEVLCEAFPDKKVQMHDPDAMVHVLVVQGSVYVYARSERGVGGLPVGSAGKVVTLLSSGIDSPVATWMLARRGWFACRYISPVVRRRPIRVSIWCRISSVRLSRVSRSAACTWCRLATASVRFRSPVPATCA